MAANCVIVDNIWSDRLLIEIRKEWWQKINPCGATKKNKENKIRRCNGYTHFISFFAGVILYCIIINILHRI